MGVKHEGYRDNHKGPANIYEQLPTGKFWVFWCNVISANCAGMH
jgi:hypothetical protein